MELCRARFAGYTHSMQWLSTTEAARLLHVHPDTLRKRAAAGNLGDVEIDLTPGGHRRYRADHIRSLAQRGWDSALSPAIAVSTSPAADSMIPRPQQPLPVWPLMLKSGIASMVLCAPLVFMAYYNDAMMQPLQDMRTLLAVPSFAALIALSVAVIAWPTSKMHNAVAICMGISLGTLIGPSILMLLIALAHNIQYYM